MWPVSGERDFGALDTQHLVYGGKEIDDAYVVGDDGRMRLLGGWLAGEELEGVVVGDTYGREESGQYAPPGVHSKGCTEHAPNC